MDETSSKLLMAWRFIRRHAVRIVIGIVLLAAVYGALHVWVPYQREQRIARKIEALGGQVSFQYTGPTWIPWGIAEQLPFLHRISMVSFVGRDLPSGFLSETRSLASLSALQLSNCRFPELELQNLNGLPHLVMLFLDDSNVTDVGLEYLKGHFRMGALDLRGTEVTNAGMVHLKGLTDLDLLRLQHTKVTSAGLEQLNGLPYLSQLSIGETQITSGGRAVLLKSFPNCQITPDP